MENKNANTKQPESENANYNPTNRDFDRTEADIDNISKSEKEELERRKERTHEANTTPDKNHAWVVDRATSSHRGYSGLYEIDGHSERMNSMERNLAYHKVSRSFLLLRCHSARGHGC